MPSSLPLFPPLHVGGPEPGGPLYTHWFLDPKIALFVFGITGLYLAWVGPLNRRRPDANQRPVSSREVRWFLLGSLAALVALGPPMDDWSHFFFVSAHMAQHLILMFVTVPLWLAGIPAWVYAPLLRNRWTAPVFRTLVRPVPAFLLSNLIMVVWHLPVLYDNALGNEVLHSAQHQFFILAGFLLWWPIMSKVPQVPALSSPLKCLYLFLQTLPSGVIGATITYAGAGLYPHYEEASVRPWGIDLKTDQEIAGLLMWVGMNSVYLILLTVIFLRWASRTEEEDRQRPAPRRRIQQPAASPAETGASGTGP